jgi:hypothetical protein
VGTVSRTVSAHFHRMYLWVLGYSITRYAVLC